MSARHLSIGSSCPPKVQGKLRLYTSDFCPYGQRVKLVLNVKKVPYDVVNVNMKQKPEWMFKIHPERKVPALDTGDKVFVNSLDIVNYLDAKYPQPPLYPSDPERKAKDQELIVKFGKVVTAMNNAFHDKEKKPLEHYMSGVYEILQEFERELESRETTFFGGEEPGMVDLMTWPWSERAKLPYILRNEDMNFPKEKYPKLIAWRQAMQELDPVKKTIIDQETHLKFLVGYLRDDPNPPFDDL
ncbi:pyrimidodiazepine synthase [Anabrus simplex]|uniref:pyrimidodiazepine synthase n=1 Tax=Anabrus simplex TaxID=316456 RepID=UPI0034DCC825